MKDMPHLLIAGQTGSGKSVGMNGFLISLLLRNSPAELRMIMVDPKRVELTLYNGIPHLLTPVITDAAKTVNALKWAIGEMDRRFTILAEAGKRDIGSYNKSAAEPMPYIVFIIDELADLMAMAASEVEAGIIRIAQMARAVGIHLIVATQRPSVEVITGLMKANIPARIALKTTSQIDSRTILDASGAEDLLGNGDMLYMASDNPRLVRLQAPFISTEEIKDVVSHIKKSYDDFVPDQIDISKVRVGAGGGSVEGGESGGEEPENDEDYMSAKDYVIATGKASTSSLQTAFRWGYNKAARIINDLEQYGVIGPARQGERYREILVGGNTGQTDNSPSGEQSSGDRDASTDELFR
jgi:S-DNA-T family DNA segregation ATPase FtsK/SpoIIIE